ncbi:unnamed protein product [Trichobilharzia regenti]|nr:unnamed protein product [Trichobilharzia regenti]
MLKSYAEAVNELKKKMCTDDDSSLVVTPEFLLRCELCEVACTGVDSYTAHISGKQHQRTLKVHKQLGKPVPETDNPLVPAAVADKLASDAAAHTTFFLKNLLQEVSLNGKSVMYRCKLCECEFSSIDTRDCHLRGRRHRNQYKTKVDPSFVVDPNSGNQLFRKSSTGKDKRNRRSDSVSGPRVTHGFKSLTGDMTSSKTPNTPSRLMSANNYET